MTGSLAPPPPYGSEQGSILLESGRKDGYVGSPSRGHSYSQSIQTYSRGPQLDTGHGRTRSGNFRVLPPTSPGPQRSPTDISLAQLVPNDEVGEGSSSHGGGASGDHAVDVVGLGLHEAAHPPPEYTSPESSDGEESRSSSESDRAPLIRTTRSRGASAATIRPSNNPPIPSYSDAVRMGAGRDRSRSDITTGRRWD